MAKAMVLTELRLIKEEGGWVHPEGPRDGLHGAGHPCVRWVKGPSMLQFIMSDSVLTD